MLEQYVVIGSVILAALVYNVPTLRSALKYLRISPLVPAFGALGISYIVAFTHEPGSWGFGWAAIFLFLAYAMVIWGVVRGVNEDFTWKI